MMASESPLPPSSLPDMLGEPTFDAGVSTQPVLPQSQPIEPAPLTAPHLPGHGPMHPSMTKRIKR